MLISFGIILRRIHIPLGIMGIITLPTGYGCSCDAVIDIIRPFRQCEARIVTAVAVAGDEPVLFFYPRFTFHPLGIGAVINPFPFAEFVVRKGTTSLAKNTRVAG